MHSLGGLRLKTAREPSCMPCSEVDRPDLRELFLDAPADAQSLERVKDTAKRHDHSPPGENASSRQACDDALHSKPAISVTALADSAVATRRGW